MKAPLNVPTRFVDATIKSWYERTDNDDVADALDQYLKDAPLHIETGRGLLLLGPPGVGKTYLISAMLVSLWKSYDVRFVTLPNYIQCGLDMMKLREQWLRRDDDDAFALYKRMDREMTKLRYEYDFVALDDVGMEHRTTSQWSEDEFQVIVRGRFDQALPTLITSNRPLDDWSTVYGAPMRSFVKEAFIIVDVNGDDLR